MKRKFSPWLILVGVVVVLATASLVLIKCQSTAKDKTAIDPITKECLRRMKMIETAASSWAMAHKITIDKEIAPAELKEFLFKRDWTNLSCPEGHKEYAPFLLSRGVLCPCSDKHNRAFDAEKRSYDDSRKDVGAQSISTPPKETTQEK